MNHFYVLYCIILYCNKNYNNWKKAAGPKQQINAHIHKQKHKDKLLRQMHTYIVCSQKLITTNAHIHKQCTVRKKAVAFIPATGPVFLRLESRQRDSNKISLCLLMFDCVRVPAEIPMPEVTGMLS